MPVRDLSVTVSVLTLTFISIDRCYAVCSPLKFKSTEGRAKWAILVIWIVASVLVSPNLFVLEAIPREGLRIETVYFTQCTPQWSPWMEVAYVLMKVILLYAFPLVLMSIAHCLIAIVLRSRQSVHGSTEENQRPNNVLHRHQRQGSSSLLNRREGGVSTSANCSAESTLRSRRKAAKMLVAVVIVFAICLFPVHLINILRIVMHVPMNDFTVAVTLGSHWLCYANSAINPLIYNFMSVKFRKEFMKAFACRTLERRGLGSEVLCLLSSPRREESSAQHIAARIAIQNIGLSHMVPRMSLVSAINFRPKSLVVSSDKATNLM
ncbi:unnamed protein product [Cyprideis torosa]|uniref:Uncharacterized protein n=1 Tax=Cyprideis torosa TaxID=163714 RepID=A0A7R8W4X2_9CRUS|nr:unnamed protein product [Cyprideis torosa]CAG0881065.1 unnamed protein product [Cyprideis torosa]